MYTQTLVDKLIQDGERLLVEMENADLDPTAVFWFFNPELETWKLVVSFPAYDGISTQEAYREMQHLRSRPQPEIAIPLNDIALQSSHSPLVGAVRRAVRPLPTSDRKGFHYIGETVNNQFIGDVYIYRV